MASSTEAQTLKSGSIHKWHVLLQSIAFMAPAGAIVVTTPIIIGEVGYGTPLIFLIATVACLCIANSVAELTKKYPSAGSFYSANREALGPAAGFITGWLMLIGYALIAAGGIAFAAYWAQLLFEHWSIDLPFVVPFLVFAALLFALPYRGIKISIQFDTTVIFFEVGVLLALAVTAISMATGSTEGGNVGSMVSSDAFSNGAQPFFLAFVFGILAFVGFESGAALAEETSEPRKAIPFAVFGATAAVGIFYVVWHLVVLKAYGAVLTTTEEQPLAALSEGLWGSAWFPLIAFVAMYGTLGFSIAAHNTVARAMFAMGRDGVLPSKVGEVHPRLHTPAAAVLVTTCIELIVGLPLGLSVGGDFTWYYLGFIATFALILVYGSINVSLMVLMSGPLRAERRIFRDVVLPAVGTIAMLAALVGNVYPQPESPYRYFPYLVVGLILVGILVLAWLRAKRPESLRRAEGFLAGVEDEQTAEAFSGL